MAAVFAVMGGWVISESKCYQERHRRSIVLAGIMFFFVAIGLVNRMRLSVIFASEDWLTIILRVIAIVFGVASLISCCRHPPSTTRPGDRP